MLSEYERIKADNEAWNKKLQQLSTLLEVAMMIAGNDMPATCDGIGTIKRRIDDSLAIRQGKKI